MIKKAKINVIGAGLAGCEAAYYLAEHDFLVQLFEMKPIYHSPAHKMDSFAELVCSNSLKSTLPTSASGLLKSELEILDSMVLKVAKECAVPSGNALSVERNDFSEKITHIIKNHKNINVINERITEINLSEPTIVATGPLTDNDLFKHLQQIIGEKYCYFYDAVAPIVVTDSLDMTKCFWANRYGTPEEKGDYLNCFLSEEEYNIFYEELVKGKTIELKEFEDLKVFEGCMPVEVLAKRGKNSLRFGPMKPVGLSRNIYDVRPYAVVQLRKENEEGTSLNMVGFQTNLTFGEQKRIFSLIPALKNAEFLRYGIMHRNSYVNAPHCLNNFSQLVINPNIFIAGQLSGVEGYMESVASGLYVAINMARYVSGKELIALPNTTVLGGMLKYISSTSPINFQPMNANYSIVAPLDENVIDKQQKKQLIYERSIRDIIKYKEKIDGRI